MYLGIGCTADTNTFAYYAAMSAKKAALLSATLYVQMIEKCRDLNRKSRFDQGNPYACGYWRPVHRHLAPVVRGAMRACLAEKPQGRRVTCAKISPLGGS